MVWGHSSKTSVYDESTAYITTSQPLAQGQTLVSPGHIFELGFFSPNNSANKYVGIWHRDISPRKVVWVANRENPLADGKQNAVWSTKVTIPVSSFNASPAAVLLDNGNFIVRDHMGADHFIWWSFDYPGDTMLPNMVLGYNRKSGKSSILTAWKNESDPSTGIFSAAGGLAKEMPGQVIIWMNRSTPYWKSGPWDKSKFIGVHVMDNQYLNGFELDEHVEQGTISFTYRVFDETLAYMDISPEGKLKLMHSDNGGNWHVYWQAQQNPCDIYGACGPFWVCNNASASPICRCLKVFVPKSDDEWSKGNWTGGCVRQTKLLCKSHTSCLVWSKDLIDIQEFPSGGVDLFSRLADSGDMENQIKLTASLAAICFISILAVILFGLHRLRANQIGGIKTTRRRLGLTDKVQRSGNSLQEYMRKHDLSELLIFKFDSMSIATNNFSIINKLGEGGFGPVYRCKLGEGKEIAVKRLSSSSGQGIQEFKNEVLLISKLQHKNLVRIMGFCVRENEKLLIYEFMPNKSLDTLLFDQMRKAVLDWASRFNIIQEAICLRSMPWEEYFQKNQMSTALGSWYWKSLAARRIATSITKNNSQQLGFLAYAWHLWTEGKGLDFADEEVAKGYSLT
ncbi:hypothetical protein ABKV19_006758 [Rosa sericea]